MSTKKEDGQKKTTLSTNKCLVTKLILFGDKLNIFHSQLAPQNCGAAQWLRFAQRAAQHKK
jgi:hypothetical protein